MDDIYEFEPNVEADDAGQGISMNENFPLLRQFLFERLEAVLAKYCNGDYELDSDEWKVDIVRRNTGLSAGCIDVMYQNARGKKYRNRIEVAISLGLVPYCRNVRGMPREQLHEIAIEGREKYLISQQLAIGGFKEDNDVIAHGDDILSSSIQTEPSEDEQLCFAFGNTTVLSWGKIVADPGFHTKTQIYPFGFRCLRQEHDVLLDTLVDCLCEIDGICGGGRDRDVMIPIFRITVAWDIPSSKAPPTAASLATAPPPSSTPSTRQEADNEEDPAAKLMDKAEDCSSINGDGVPVAPSESDCGTAVLPAVDIPIPPVLPPVRVRVVRVYEGKSPQQAWQAAMLEDVGLDYSIYSDAHTSLEEEEDSSHCISEEVAPCTYGSGMSIAESSLRSDIRERRREFFRALRIEQCLGLQAAVKPRLAIESVDLFVDEFLLRMLEGMEDSLLYCPNYQFLDSRVKDPGRKSIQRACSKMNQFSKYVDRVEKKHLVSFQNFCDRQRSYSERETTLKRKRVSQGEGKTRGEGWRDKAEGERRVSNGRRKSYVDVPTDEEMLVEKERLALVGAEALREREKKKQIQSAHNAYRLKMKEFEKIIRQMKENAWKVVKAGREEAGKIVSASGEAEMAINVSKLSHDRIDELRMSMHLPSCNQPSQQQDNSVKATCGQDNVCVSTPSILAPEAFPIPTYSDTSLSAVPCGDTMGYLLEIWGFFITFHRELGVHAIPSLETLVDMVYQTDPQVFPADHATTDYDGDAEASVTLVEDDGKISAAEAYQLLNKIGVTLCKPLYNEMLKWGKVNISAAEKEAEGAGGNAADDDDSPVDNSANAAAPSTFLLNTLNWKEVARIVLLAYACKELGMNEAEINLSVRGRACLPSPDAADRRILKLAKLRIIYGHKIREDLQSSSVGFTSGVCAAIPMPSSNAPSVLWPPCRDGPSSSRRVGSTLVQTEGDGQSILDRWMCVCAAGAEYVSGCVCVATIQNKPLRVSRQFPPEAVSFYESSVDHLTANIDIDVKAEEKNGDTGGSLEISNSTCPSMDVEDTLSSACVETEVNGDKEAKGEVDDEDAQEQRELEREKLLVDQLTVAEQRCYRVIRDLMSYPQAVDFCLPVDHVTYPTYYEIIRQPVCLRDIRVHLMNNRYPKDKLLRSIYQDVCLVFENALTFNGENYVIAKAAQKLLVIFDRLFFEMVLCWDKPLDHFDCCHSCRSMDHASDVSDSVICDRCDGEYHISCMPTSFCQLILTAPTNTSVPRPDWYCDKCIEQKSVADIHPYRLAMVRIPRKEVTSFYPDENVSNGSSMDMLTGDVVAIEQHKQTRQLMFIIQFMDGTRSVWDAVSVRKYCYAMDSDAAAAASGVEVVKEEAAATEVKGQGHGNNSAPEDVKQEGIAVAELERPLESCGVIPTVEEPFIAPVLPSGYVDADFDGVCGMVRAYSGVSFGGEYDCSFILPYLNPQRSYSALRKSMTDVHFNECLEALAVLAPPSISLSDTPVKQGMDGASERSLEQPKMGCKEWLTVFRALQRRCAAQSSFASRMSKLDEDTDHAASKLRNMLLTNRAIVNTPPHALTLNTASMSIDRVSNLWLSTLFDGVHLKLDGELSDDFTVVSPLLQSSTACGKVNVIAPVTCVIADGFFLSNDTAVSNAMEEIADEADGLIDTVGAVAAVAVKPSISPKTLSSPASPDDDDASSIASEDSHKRAVNDSTRGDLNGSFTVSTAGLADVFGNNDSDIDGSQSDNSSLDFGSELDSDEDEAAVPVFDVAHWKRKRDGRRKGKEEAMISFAIIKELKAVIATEEVKLKEKFFLDTDELPLLAVGEEAAAAPMGGTTPCLLTRSDYDEFMLTHGLTTPALQALTKVVFPRAADVTVDPEEWSVAWQDKLNKIWSMHHTGETTDTTSDEDMMVVGNHNGETEVKPLCGLPMTASQQPKSSGQLCSLCHLDECSLGSIFVYGQTWNQCAQWMSSTDYRTVVSCDSADPTGGGDPLAACSFQRRPLLHVEPGFQKTKSPITPGVVWLPADGKEAVAELTELAALSLHTGDYTELSGTGSNQVNSSIQYPTGTKYDVVSQSLEGGVVHMCCADKLLKIREVLIEKLLTPIDISIIQTLGGIGSGKPLPIGTDRHGNTYWVFCWSGALYVSSPPKERDMIGLGMTKHRYNNTTAHKMSSDAILMSMNCIELSLARASSAPCQTNSTKVTHKTISSGWLVYSDMADIGKLICWLAMESVEKEQSDDSFLVRLIDLLFPTAVSSYRDQCIPKKASTDVIDKNGDAAMEVVEAKDSSAMECVDSAAAVIAAAVSMAVCGECPKDVGEGDRLATDTQDRVSDKVIQQYHGDGNGGESDDMSNTSSNSDDDEEAPLTLATSRVRRKPKFKVYSPAPTTGAAAGGDAADTDAADNTHAPLYNVRQTVMVRDEGDVRSYGNGKQSSDVHDQDGVTDALWWSAKVLDRRRQSVVNTRKGTHIKHSDFSDKTVTWYYKVKFDSSSSSSSSCTVNKNVWVPEEACALRSSSSMRVQLLQQQRFLATAAQVPIELQQLDAYAYLNDSGNRMGSMRPPMWYNFGLYPRHLRAQQGHCHRRVSREVYLIRYAMLLVESVLPVGAIDETSEEKWGLPCQGGDDWNLMPEGAGGEAGRRGDVCLEEAWREAVMGATEASTLMQCQISLEYGIKTAWLKSLVGVKMMSSLPSRAYAMRHATYSMIAYRIWMLDAALRYEKHSHTKASGSSGSGSKEKKQSSAKKSAKKARK